MSALPCHLPSISSLDYSSQSDDMPFSHLFPFVLKCSTSSISDFHWKYSKIVSVAAGFACISVFSKNLFLYLLTYRRVFFAPWPIYLTGIMPTINRVAATACVLCSWPVQRTVALSWQPQPLLVSEDNASPLHWALFSLEPIGYASPWPSHSTSF